MSNEELIHIQTEVTFMEMRGNVLLQSIFLYCIMTEEKLVEEEASLAILIS